jgi:hypothetical protein
MSRYSRWASIRVEPRRHRDTEQPKELTTEARRARRKEEEQKKKLGDGEMCQYPLKILRGSVVKSSFLNSVPLCLCGRFRRLMTFVTFRG